MAERLSELEPMEPWERAELAGQRLNELLHEEVGLEPCETACTHLVMEGFSTLTMLGFANSFARGVQRHFDTTGDNDG